MITVLLFCVFCLPSVHSIFYTFYSNQDTEVWKLWDYSKLTTIAIFSPPYTKGLIDLAHENNVTLQVVTKINSSCVQSPDCRAAFNHEQVSIILENNLDGLNIDVEWAADVNSSLSQSLTDYVRETRDTLTAAGVRELSFDAASKPGQDGRWYDYLSISQITDFLFVMAYDEQSQMGDPPCTAKANSPLHETEQGLQAFFDLGVAPEKMVLGLPWYGYDYPCVSYSADTCTIESVPFRGSACSDAAGSETSLSSLYTSHEDLIPNSVFHWESVSMSYVYNATSEIDSKRGQSNDTRVHQIWYDNPTTLRIKYELARKLGLLGIGSWELDNLYYGDNKNLMQITEKMWEIIPSQS